MDSQEILSLCKRRGFLWPAYDIYGGLAGMYDYGPLGAALKNNMENHWRRLYVLGEGFLEISCPIIAPEPVFKASGHLDAFADMYVECLKCHESYRADHLAEGLHDNPATLKEDELGELLNDNDVKCPNCKGDLTDPRKFNLMFKTSVGAGVSKPGYLRPETAQGMFVNFSQVYRHAREKLPVGAVQIGKAFRNEISPRQGLLRLREFHQMEAELFVHPENKSWPRFSAVKDTKLPLVPNSEPARVMTLAEAVDQNVIVNETLAYFIYLTYKYACDIGLDPSRLRFRQHEKDEMAHYASDCWDMEAELSFGWIEMVGIADRGCYDLQAHINHSGSELMAFELFDEPKEVEEEVVRARFDVMGKLFKGETKKIADALSKLPAESVKGKAEVSLDVDGQAYKISSDCFEVIMRKEKVSGRKLVPHVIEPSYGVDRMLYSLLEHSYTKKDDYIVLRFNGRMAPVKAGVFPLMARDGLDSIAVEVQDSITFAGMTAYYDDSGSIGRRYARMDEIGAPCCVTVDYETKTNGTVTIRDRDSANQVRIKKENVAVAVARIVSGAGLEALEGL
ncbi:MAG: glycine--tRNA ligase [Thermoplasmata archaeon]|nr:glycine--tRNA ligase [Thermoplasmata archaeon]